MKYRVVPRVHHRARHLVLNSLFLSTTFMLSPILSFVLVSTMSPFVFVARANVRGPVARPIPSRQATEGRVIALQALTEAEKAAAAEPHSSIRAEQIASIAVLYMKAGEPKKRAALAVLALELIQEKDDPAENCDECFGKFVFQALVAVDLYQAGQPKAGAKLLDQMAADAQRAGPFRAKSRYLAGLATVFARIGETSRAQALLDESLTLARDEKDEFDKYQALEEIAIRNANLGNIPKALVAASQMNPAFGGQKAWAAIARAYVTAGQNEAALELAQRQPEGNLNSEVMVTIARQYLEKGKREEAISLLTQAQAAIDKNRKKQVQQLASPDITELFVLAGEYKRAVALANRASPRNQLQLAPFLARAGHMKEAEKLLTDASRFYVRKGSDSFYDAIGIIEIANAYSAVGNRAKAADLLNKAMLVGTTMKQSEVYDALYVDLVRGFVNLGDSASAVSIAGRIEGHSASKVEAYLIIAIKHLGAEALTTERNRIYHEFMMP